MINPTNQTGNSFGFFKTDFFELFITATHKGVSRIDFLEDKKSFLKTGKIKREMKNGSSVYSKKVLDLAIAELDGYFSGIIKKFTVAIDVPGTVFQLSVWEELKKIPYGTTVSYSEIALQIKNPSAMRAVGNANNKNPVPIIVPCHRVIGKNGHISGYGSGEKYKRILLSHEQKYLHFK
jgi:O-6-methylguanine DNA methyltransferase